MGGIMPQEDRFLKPIKRYRIDPRDACRACALDDLTLLYHARSGQTHMVISPVPEILDSIEDGASVTADDLWDRLTQSYDLGDRGQALAQIGAQLEALEALGLVRAA